MIVHSHRIPAGTPAGGQFASVGRGEADGVRLAEPTDRPAPVYSVTGAVALSGVAEPIGQTWAPATPTPAVDPTAVVDDARVSYTYSAEDQRHLLAGVTGEEQHRYTADRCGYLAVALHQRTGWPLVVFADGYDHDDPPPHPGWVHAGVLTPDGRFLDIDGPGDWGRHWDQWVDYVDEGEDEATVEQIDPALFTAHDFHPTEDDHDVADRVLRAIGLAHLART